METEDREMLVEAYVYPLDMVEVGGPKLRYLTEYFLKIEIDGVRKMLVSYKTEKQAIEARDVAILSLQTTGELPSRKRKTKKNGKKTN
jgi:hypothetical protein